MLDVDQVPRKSKGQMARMYDHLSKALAAGKAVELDRRDVVGVGGTDANIRTKLRQAMLNRGTPCSVRIVADVVYVSPKR
jgi:hypothetical protein